MAYSEPIQLSTMELFAKIVNGFSVAKSYILVVLLGSKCASEIDFLFYKKKPRNQGKYDEATTKEIY